MRLLLSRVNTFIGVQCIWLLFSFGTRKLVTVIRYGPFNVRWKIPR